MKKQHQKIVEATSTTDSSSSTSTSSPRAAPRKKKAAAAMTMTRSREKESVAVAVAAVVVAEEKGRDNIHGVDGTTSLEASLAAEVVESGEDWRTWWRPGVLVDEQMSWGSVWYSLGDDADFHAFYGDVLEEDDIWDLRSTKQAPSQ